MLKLLVFCVAVFNVVEIVAVIVFNVVDVVVVDVVLAGALCGGRVIINDYNGLRIVLMALIRK